MYRIVKCIGCGYKYFTPKEIGDKTANICGACRNGYEVPLGYNDSNVMKEFSSNG